MRKEDDRASAKGCLGWRGRSKKPAISTTAVATEGSLVKAAQPSPRFLQLNGSPKTQAELRKAPTQLKVKGERAVRERGRGISRRGQDNASNPTRCNEIEKRRKTGRTHLHNHLCNDPTGIPQEIFKQISKISHCCLAALCQPSWMSASASALDVLGQAIVVRSGIYGGIAAALFVAALAGVLDVVALVAWEQVRLGTGQKRVSDKVFLVLVDREFLLSEIDGSPVATSQASLGGGLGCRASILDPEDEQVDGRVKSWNGVLVGVDMVRPS